MGGAVHIARKLSRPEALFADRAAAGSALAAYIDPVPDPRTLVFALPRGGIPVGRPLADALGCRLLPALVRKLPIPSDPEMGFGAVTIDGTVRLNRPVISAFGISEERVARVAEEVRAEVERRAAAYPGGWPLPQIEGADVWLVDDGLATGLTMLAAADMIAARSPASLRLAVPCSPEDSLDRVRGSFGEIWCLAVQTGRPFAVASYYLDFHDLTDAEVRAELET